MMDSDNRASSPRFQSSKTILRSQNADFRHQYTHNDANVYEYVEMSKQNNKIPDVKKKPIYDQDYKYPKYVIFCSKNTEIDRNSKSPPNKTQTSKNAEKPELPIEIVQKKFDGSILDSHDIARRLSETSSEIISKFKNLVDYEQNYGHAYEDLYAAEHSYEYVDATRSTRFHVQKIEEPKSKSQENLSDLKIQPDDNVYEALDNHRPSRFRVTRVDEAAFQKSQNVYEPICIRPRWVDYLYIPPPHKRLPKKDCMGRVQWLNKPVRKKTSLGRKTSSSNSRKNSDNIDSNRKDSKDLDSHIYENTICEQVSSKTQNVPLEHKENSENIEPNSTEKLPKILSNPEPLIKQQTHKEDDLEANSSSENTDVEGLRTYEAVFL